MDRDLHSGHRERLRRRAQEEGLDGFNPHQVLELLLFYAIPRQDTSAIAHRLIDRFGSVAQVLSQPADELRKVSGVGQRAARWLTSLGTLTEAYGALTQADRVVIRNHADAARFCAGLEGEILRPQAWQICMTPVGVVQACSKIADSAAWAEAEWEAFLVPAEEGPKRLTKARSRQDSLTLPELTRPKRNWLKSWTS